MLMVSEKASIEYLKYCWILYKVRYHVSMPFLCGDYLPSAVKLHV